MEHEKNEFDVQPLTQEEEAAWDAYVHAHPDGTLFHLTGWKRVVEKTFGHQHHYHMLRQNGRLRGIAPVFEIKSLLFGHSFVSIPFAEVGGILADSSVIEERLMEALSRRGRQRKVDYLELRNTCPRPDLLTKDLYYNFSRKIFLDNDRNLAAIPRKSRAMVRKGIKKGLTIETGHHLLPVFYHLISLNFHRLGTPTFPRRFFANFLEEFRRSADILVVRDPMGTPVAGVLYFIYKDRMMPYYAGSDVTYRHLGINDFMYWRLMCLAVKKNASVFDYGRSKQGTGSFDFKKHWGFSPTPLAYQYVLIRAQQMPNLSPANPRYRRKIELWRKMPLELTRFMGPFISKYLA